MKYGERKTHVSGVFPLPICRECKIKMEIKGDLRYEDAYFQCPKCKFKKEVIIRF